MSTVSVNARLFRAVAAFVSTEETRYYLQGVHIEPHANGGVILVATDGARLMCAWDQRGVMKGDAPIVKLDKAALTACKSVRGEDGDRRILVEDNNATILNVAGDPVATAYNVLIDGTFPAWRRVVPNIENPVPSTFPASTLVNFASAAHELTGNKDTGIHIVGGGINSPALVRFLKADYAFGLLMSNLRQAAPSTVPEFMNASEAPAAAA